MLKKLYGFVCLLFIAFFMSGCGALIATAVSAAASYGIYQATK